MLEQFSKPMQRVATFAAKECLSQQVIILNVCHNTSSF